MAETTHILHFNSDSSKASNPGNDPRDFVCRLPQPLVLESAGDWSACLRQCSFGFQFGDSPLYVCCDVVSDVVAGERRLPVLRVVHQKIGVFYDTCLFIPLKVNFLSELRFYVVKTSNYKRPGFDSARKKIKPTHFTLELKRTRHGTR